MKVSIKWKTGVPLRGLRAPVFPGGSFRGILFFFGLGARPGRNSMKIQAINHLEISKSKGFEKEAYLLAPSPQGFMMVV